MSKDNPTYFEMLLTQSQDSRAERFVWQPHEKLILITGPGDGGPCPICGEDMRGKLYEEQSLFDTDGVKQILAGRYWHMKNEHGIFEHYQYRWE